VRNATVEAGSFGTPAEFNVFPCGAPYCTVAVGAKARIECRDFSTSKNSMPGLHCWCPEAIITGSLSIQH
jgi:hypothetical protein